MLCPKCGIYNAEQAKTCLRCGCDLIAERPQHHQKKKKTRQRKGSSGIGAMITMCIFLVLSVALIVLTFAFR